MQQWNEELKGFLFYIPGCERIKIIIDNIERYKGFIYNMPIKYQNVQVEEITLQSVRSKNYFKVVCHWPLGYFDKYIENRKGVQKQW